MAVRQSFAVVSMAVCRPSTMCISKTSAMVVDGLPAWAKYTYKAKEKVKGKWKTVTKSVTRTFALTVAPAIGMDGGSILTRQNFTTVPRFMV